MKRVAYLYYDSLALHLFVLSAVLTLILPWELRITHAIGVGLLVIGNERFMYRLPNLFTTKKIPDWYPEIVALYWGVAGTYYITADLGEYIQFLFYDLPIVALPVTILSTIVIVRLEGLQPDQYDVP